MRFNTQADLAGGVGANHSSLWLYGQAPRVLHPTVDGGAWWDNTRILSRDNGLGQMVLFNRADDFTIEHGMLPPQMAVSDWYAGGGNWAGTVRAGAFPTYGQFDGGPIPDPFGFGYVVLDANRAGALLFGNNNDGHSWILWPNGDSQDIGPQLETRLGEGGAISWDGHDLIIWDQGHGPTYCDHVPVGGLNKPARLGDWVSYASDELGRVLHLWNDATIGYYLTMVYSPDLLMYGGACLAAGSLNEAETPDKLVRDAPILLGSGMVPLLTTPSPGPDPEPTPEPEPEPKPPMPVKPRTIALRRDWPEGPRYFGFKDDRVMVTLEYTDPADPRCHLKVIAVSESGMWDELQKVELLSAQDEQFVIATNVQISANSNTAGIFRLLKGEFPNTWHLLLPFDPALPGVPRTPAITGDPYGQGRDTVGMMPNGLPLPSHQDFVVVDVTDPAHPKEIHGPF